MNTTDDVTRDYQAAKTAAALFDLSDRSQIELTGADRAKFLHNFCTNDIIRLNPGAGCEAYVTNIKGRVLGHVFVFVAPDSIWMDSVPGADQTLLTHLDRYLIMDDVELQARTADFAELLLAGPEAAGVLDRLQIDTVSLQLHGHMLCDADGLTFAVRLVDWLGQPGFLISAARDRLDEAHSRLIAAGAHPAGRSVFEALRIEAGFPLYGTDFDEENLAQEVGRTARAISFTKGCYLGQEPIARLDAMGHVNRLLCGLRLESGPVPEPGTELFAEGDDDQPIGKVTSATTSPADDRPVVLAFLRSQFTEPGTAVTVGRGDVSVPATVFQPYSS